VTREAVTAAASAGMPLLSAAANNLIGARAFSYCPTLLHYTSPFPFAFAHEA
jgi:hypothetical protein